MCARYGLTDPLSLANRFLLPSEVPTTLRPRYHAAPTQRLPVITQRKGNELEVMRWGLVPRWAKDLRIGKTLINARSETAAEKPSFRAPFRAQRCLIPATHYFEWAATGEGKVPHLIRLAEEPVFSFAGLYDVHEATGEQVQSFTLLTTAPNERLAWIHDRMPAILDREGEQAWLDRDATVADLQALLRPYPGDAMEAYPVSRLVNAPAHDVPEVLQPVAGVRGR